MIIDRYELKAKLGQTPIATAYRAFDPKLERDVVLKLYTSLGDDASHRKRFQREARALASLRHPNIVHVFDFGESDDGRLYLVTEYVRGPTLATWLKAHGVMPGPLLLAVGIELATALTHAHTHGVIHRALRPENVLLDRGRLVLTDFGMVKAVHKESPLGPEAAQTRTAMIGSPGFIAPEQIEQKRLDARTDLFGLAMLLYYAATLRLAFEAENLVALRELFRAGKPDALTRLRPDLSRALCNLIHQGLEPQIKARPESALIVRLMCQHLLERGGLRDARQILAASELDPSLEKLDWKRGSKRESGGLPASLLALAKTRRRIKLAWLLTTLGAALGAVAAWLYLGR